MSTGRSTIVVGPVGLAFYLHASVPLAGGAAADSSCPRRVTSFRMAEVHFGGMEFEMLSFSTANARMTTGKSSSGRRRRAAGRVSVLVVLAMIMNCLLNVGIAQGATVSGCDPITGATVTRDLAQLINPTKSGPTPQYVAPDRDGTLGTLWTPSCEPTNTTGNGSCFTSERQQVIVVTLDANLAKKLSPKLPVGLNLQLVWVVLRQVKNDSTTDFMTFFMISPILTASFTGTWNTSVQAQYTHAWYALYRVLTDPPSGTNLPSPDTVWTALSTYGQFLALGGLTKDTSAMSIADFFGAPVLPAPFLTGQFDGGRVGLTVAGTTVGLTSWAGPYAIDINGADPTNMGAELYGSAAPGGTADSIATLPGDVVKIQPDMVTTSVALGAPVNAIMGSMFTGTPMSWLNTLKASFSTGIVLDQLDMSSVKSSTGVEQSGAIEMVVRVPLLLTLDFAPAGTAAASEASTWWNSVKNDSKWAAWAKNARATASFTGGPYLSIRYTKKVDLAGRTSATTGNLAKWQAIKAKWGFDPTDVASLFGPDGDAAIQMYSGAMVTVTNPLGALSLKLPGTKALLGLSTLTSMVANVSITEQKHNLIGAWHDAAGQSGVSWVPWTGCTGSTYTDPNSAIYGPNFQSSFTPGPYDLFNPAAPHYVWPTNPGLSRLVQPLLDNITSALTTAATEIASSKNIATKIANFTTDKANVVATWAKCKLGLSCPYTKTLVSTDASTLGGKTYFYNDREEAEANNNDGGCVADGTGYDCTTYNGNGNAVITFPAAGTKMYYSGAWHTASRSPQGQYRLPYCLPQWYLAGDTFHNSTPEFSNDATPTNTYYCAFWSELRLINTASGRCLDVSGQSTADNAWLELYDCNHGPNQIWVPTTAGELKVYGYMCLDDPAASSTPGAGIDIYGCDGGTNQQWTFAVDGTIRSVANGMCLEATGGGTANGTGIDISTCNGTARQRWSGNAG